MIDTKTQFERESGGEGQGRIKNFLLIFDEMPLKTEKDAAHCGWALRPFTLAPFYPPSSSSNSSSSSHYFSTVQTHKDQ